MSFNDRLHNLRYTLAPGRGQRHRRRRGSLRAATHRLNVEVLEDRLTPSFTWGGNYPLSEFDLGGATTVEGGSAAADFNGDGRWDTATLSRETNTISLRLNNGDGTWSDSGVVAIGAYSVVAGDFTNDGIPDLLIGREQELAVLPGHGDGTFAAPIRSLGPTAARLAVADFNGDGQPDVFAVQGTIDYGAGGIVCFGRGDGTFDAQQYTGAGWDWTAIGDFNDDARTDVAAMNYDYDLGEWVVSEYLNAGDWEWGPYLFFGDATVSEGNTGTANANFTLTLAHASNVDLTFNYDTADGSATAGSDYQAASGTLTIPAGQTTGTIAVLVKGDSLPEPNETFSVYLSREHWSGVTIGYGIGTIADDEPHISIGDATVTEGNTGTRAANFAVTLSAASSQTITVAYATGDSSAVAGSDYQAASGTLTFAPGETSKTISVPVNGDRVPEPNETFVVNLSTPTNATIADGQGVATIMDDEPRVSISDVSKKEGNGKKTMLFVFTVTLSAAYDQPVTMSYRTVDGMAKVSDQDYVANTGTLTFAPGETTKSVTIVVNGDSKKEANETFYLDLFGNSSNALFTKSRGLGTILNDD